MEYFRHLGESIRATWSRTGFDTAALPDIACDALTGARHPGTADIVHWLATTADGLPEQHDIDAQFGQPPITLYHSPEMYISALFWHTGTTSIHQHAFCGAFTVLEGSSLEARYTFTRQQTIDDSVAIGAIALERVCLLQRGDVRRIVSGPAGIHSVFHLDAPTVSLVIRTPRIDAAWPQYDYLPPLLSYDPTPEDPLLTRRMQVLTSLLRADTGRYEQAAVDIIEHANPLTCVRVLMHAYLQSDVSVSTARLLSAGARRHGAWVERLAPVMDETVRREIVTSRRSQIVDPDHRYLLALLANLSERDDIFRMVEARVPGRSPLETIEQWALGMSGTDTVGISFDALNTLIFRYLLHGATGPEAVIERLSADYEAAALHAQRASLCAHIQDIAHSRLFQNLFVRAS